MGFHFFFKSLINIYKFYMKSKIIGLDICISFPKF